MRWILPNLIDLQAITLTGFAELALVTLVVLTAIDGAYVLLAARARRLIARPHAMRLVNRGAGALLAGTAVAVANR